jgi:hypothetical protein
MTKRAKAIPTIDAEKLMPSRHSDIRFEMLALKSAPDDIRFIRLVAAKMHGRSGCNRLFTLRGHYDSGSFVSAARGIYEKSPRRRRKKSKS